MGSVLRIGIKPLQEGEVVLHLQLSQFLIYGANWHIHPDVSRCLIWQMHLLISSSFGGTSIRCWVSCYI